MLLTNNGHGGATNVRMASAQPEIVENERGLLVAFQIVGTILNANAVSPSLLVNIGTLLPRSTVMLRWLMTSSLVGRFTNFTASFESNNPLGDAELNLVKNVTTHALAHVVRLPGIDDDGIPDFLVDDATEIVNFPEAVYDSRNNTVPHSVSRLALVGVAITAASSARFTFTAPFVTGYVYMSSANPFPGQFPTHVEVEGVPINVEFNAWRSYLVTHVINGTTVEVSRAFSH
jgi:hypothetical protein